MSIARLLWLPSYKELFEAELLHNRHLVGRASGAQLPPSTYRARLQGAHAELYDIKRLKQERDQLAIEVHANNMRHWSPSLVSRSIAKALRTSALLHHSCIRSRLVTPRSCGVLAHA